MIRETHQARLFMMCSAQRLTYPPGRIGAKFVPCPIIELFYRTNQADIALLDQIEQGQYRVDILFIGPRQGYHQTEISLDKALMCRFARFDDLPIATERWFLQLVSAHLDALRQRSLFLCGEKRYVFYLAQVRSNGVVPIFWDRDIA